MSFQDPDDREAWARRAQSACAEGRHQYSKAMHQPRPRLCVRCRAPEPAHAIVASLPSPTAAPVKAPLAHALTVDEVESLREWLAHWGDGPNWSDKSGQTVPISKSTLSRLLDAAGDTAK